MDFSGESDAVAERAEVVRNTLGIGAAGAVVPGATVAMGEATGVKLGAAGRAHRHAEVGPVKDEGLFCEGVEVGCFGVLTAIERKVTECTVVGDDDENIWILCRGEG